MTPTISIGVPVYNGERYLERCLRSLQAQTVDDLEIVISDNGSEDGSLEIARDYAAADRRIRVTTSDSNRGAAWNYNRVVTESRAPFFCWTPHDDEREPTGLEHCLEALEQNGPTAVLAHNRAVFIDEASNIVRTDDDRFEITGSTPHRRLASALQNLNVANPVLGLMRRSALERTRLIGPFPASDYVLLAELAILGRIVDVPDHGFRRRLHDDSSRRAATTGKAVQAWFDPSRRRSLLTDRTRLLIEYHRSAMRLAPTTGDKFLSAAVIIPARTTKRVRIFGGSLKARIRAADS